MEVQGKQTVWTWRNQKHVKQLSSDECETNKCTLLICVFNTKSIDVCGVVLFHADYILVNYWRNLVRLSAVSSCSSLRSLHCVSCRSTSRRGWRPSAASSSPTCPSARHRWIHPARAPLRDSAHWWLLFILFDMHSRYAPHDTQPYQNRDLSPAQSLTFRKLQHQLTISIFVHQLEYPVHHLVRSEKIAVFVQLSVAGFLQSINRLESDRIVRYPVANNNISSPSVEPLNDVPSNGSMQHTYINSIELYNCGPYLHNFKKLCFINASTAVLVVHLECPFELVLQFTPQD